MHIYPFPLPGFTLVQDLTFTGRSPKDENQHHSKQAFPI